MRVVCTSALAFVRQAALRTLCVIYVCGVQARQVRDRPSQAGQVRDSCAAHAQLSQTNCSTKHASVRVATQKALRVLVGLPCLCRLEVGTESSLDRCKSIKSHLMRLVASAGNHDIEVGTELAAQAHRYKLTAR